MPFSRLYKHKDVISRTKNLVRGGMYEKGKEPKWLAVALRFPPFRLPERTAFRFRPQLGQLIYPEDKLREEFYSTYDFRAHPISFFGNEEKSLPMQMCDKYVKLQMEVMEEQSLSSLESQKIVEAMIAETGEVLVRLDSLKDEYQR